MAGSTWFGWLSSLVEGLTSCPEAAPGSNEARLEERRVGALLEKEKGKPPGQRDEEMIHVLRVDYRSRQLRNVQAVAARHARFAVFYEQSIARECCAAAGWVWRRLAASNRALSDYYCQHIEQVKEELAAAQARRPAVIVAEPALRLDLSAALQEPPPRLDMCSACAELILKAELREEGFRIHAEHLRSSNRLRGLQPAPAATGVGHEAAGYALSAAYLPAGEAPPQQQQGRQQQGQQHCGGDSIVCGTESGAPATPTQQAVAPTPQQRQTSSEKEHGQ